MSGWFSSALSVVWVKGSQKWEMTMEGGPQDQEEVQEVYSVWKWIWRREDKVRGEGPLVVHVPKRGGLH